MHAEPAVADQDLAQPVPRPEKQQVPQVQLHEVHHSSQHADELAPGGDQQTAVTSESVQAPVTAETEMLHSTGGHAAHPRTINGDEQMDIG